MYLHEGNVEIVYSGVAHGNSFSVYVHANYDNDDPFWCKYEIIRKKDVPVKIKKTEGTDLTPYVTEEELLQAIQEDYKIRQRIRAEF